MTSVVDKNETEDDINLSLQRENYLTRRKQDLEIYNQAIEERDFGTIIAMARAPGFWKVGT